MKPVTVLVDNLRFLCHQNPGEWSPSKTATDYSQRSWINPTILKNQKDSYEKTALKTTEKMTNIWELRAAENELNLLMKKALEKE